MSYAIEKKLVVAVASSALFDLSDSDAVFRKQGTDAYREHQRAHENDLLKPGVAFPFIQRLLHLNKRMPEDQPIEVVLISRNDFDTGLRVFNSIERHGLGITRAAFTSGRAPYPFIERFGASLFLSANHEDVREAVENRCPAGLVLDSEFLDDGREELRLAFDFDGVVASDESEKVFQAEGLDRFQATERELAELHLQPGPLMDLLRKITVIQDHEERLRRTDPTYVPLLRTAIITSRNAPAHKRVVTTLRTWNLRVDEAFFLGGMDKTGVVEAFRPHIFFDDQRLHADRAARRVPSVHVPFGIANRPAATALIPPVALVEDPAPAKSDGADSAGHAPRMPAAAREAIRPAVERRSGGEPA